MPPPATKAAAAWAPHELRYEKFTWVTTPFAAAASRMRRASARLVARGFSHITGSPRSMAASDTGACAASTVTTETASIPPASSIARWSAYHLGMP